MPAFGAERGIDSNHVGWLLAMRSAASLISRLFYARMIYGFGRAPLTLGSMLVSAAAFAVAPAIANAVIDALQRGGYKHVKHIDMPVSPSRVWNANLIDAQLPANHYDLIFTRWVFLFLPDLVRLDVGPLAQRAGLPGSRLIPAAAPCVKLACLRSWNGRTETSFRSGDSTTQSTGDPFCRASRTDISVHQFALR